MTVEAASVEATARRVVLDYLDVRSGERFAIVLDTRTSPEIGEELRRAAESVGAQVRLLVIDPLPRSGTEPPSSVAAEMRDADVVLCAASTSLYHTAAKAAAQRAGTRGDFNAPYRADAWRHGAMTADFAAIRRQAEQLAGLWRGTHEVHVISPAGTDLRATVTGREPVAWRTGIVHEPGEVSALPGGEVSLPPLEGTAEGIVVWERVASDLGGLDAPVRIEVHAGRATRIEGGASADRLRDVVANVRDADNIGEIGIGLNRAARIADEITEAKKAYGTVHIALGDSANEYGGTVECDVHLDGLIISPTVAFDGREVVVDGRHVYVGD
jgi:leucyl aminopeptidase (aminopeptidase T)